MKRQTKLNSTEHQQQEALGQQAQQPAPGLEFATPEELLRYDAARTPVPAEIEQRLQESAADLPRPKRAWWKRFWGRAR